MRVGAPDASCSIRGEHRDPAGEFGESGEFDCCYVDGDWSESRS